MLVEEIGSDKLPRKLSSSFWFDFVISGTLGRHKLFFSDHASSDQNRFPGICPTLVSMPQSFIYSTSKAKFSESVRMNIDFQIRTAERICPYSFIKSRDYLTYLRMHTDELVYYSSCGMYVALIHTCNVLRCAPINQVYRPNNSALHTRFIAYRTLS